MKMHDFPVIYNEEARLAAVDRLGLFDHAPEQRFDRITRLAAYMTSAPMAILSLVGAQRQWFISHHGLMEQAISREWSLCNYTLIEQDMFMVENAAQDARFERNPFVTGAPHLRFYAGMPLPDEQGHRVGVLCVVDTVARHLSSVQVHALHDLAKLAAETLVHAGHAVSAARAAEETTRAHAGHRPGDSA
ncbi:MAG: GAF domain-containing protein [Janthinobacterium lividum]